jgi:hypothetical protein
MLPKTAEQLIKTKIAAWMFQESLLSTKNDDKSHYNPVVMFNGFLGSALFVILAMEWLFIPKFIKYIIS